MWGEILILNISRITEQDGSPLGQGKVAFQSSLVPPDLSAVPLTLKVPTCKAFTQIEHQPNT